MSQEKFVTREEVMEMWHPLVPPRAISLLNRLFSERQAETKRAKAYREVAIRTRMEAWGLSYEARKDQVDAEVSRLLAQGDKPKVRP